MALQLDLSADKTLPFGIVMPNSYARIESVFITRTEIQVTVAWYKDAATAQAAIPNPVPLRTESFVMKGYDPNDPRPVKQALYGWLKEMPDFARAADV